VICLLAGVPKKSGWHMQSGRVGENHQMKKKNRGTGVGDGPSRKASEREK